MYATPAAIRRTSLELIIPSAEDFNFADWLVGLGHTDGAIVATLPVGNVVGGTVQDGYAFDVGDLSAYSNVVINIEGEIQGRGGDANGGSGSHGIISTFPFTLNISGAIHGGGGGGGDGGDGARGGEILNEVEHYVANATNPSYWVPFQSNGDDLCDTPDLDPLTYSSMCSVLFDPNTNNGRLGFPCGIDLMGHLTLTNNVHYTARKGTFRERMIPPYNPGISTETDMYSLFWGELTIGETVAGLGGKGQGYEGASVGGTIGSSTHRAGVGGTGGDGGAWGVAGGEGSDGATGLSFQTGDPTFPSGGSYERIEDENTVSTDFTTGSPGGTSGTDTTLPVAAIVNYL